jgi:hypothetical protein
MSTAAYVDDVTMEVVGIMAGYTPLRGAPTIAGRHVVVAPDGISMPAYESSGEILQRPDQPSPSHEWNVATKTWDFDLTKARDDAWERIKAKRDQDGFANLTWDGSVFQADAAAQQAITTSAQAAREAITAGQSPTFLWTLANNTNRVLTAAQMVTLFNQMMTRNKGLRDQAAMKRIEVSDALTQAELDDIVASTTPRPIPVA